MSRPDAAGVYALVECEELFERVELPCVIAFFVAADSAENPREGGPLTLTPFREELPELAEQIKAERQRVAGYVAEPFRWRYRASLAERFQTVNKELERRREETAATRQKFDLVLKGNKISARPSPFARLALQQRRLLPNVERCGWKHRYERWLSLQRWGVAAIAGLSVGSAWRGRAREATAHAAMSVLLPRRSPGDWHQPEVLPRQQWQDSSHAN